MPSTKSNFRIEPMFDAAVTNLEDIQLLAYDSDVPGENLLQDAVAYLNR